MPVDPIALRARRANGIPVESQIDRPLVDRIVRNPWSWITLIATLVYAACLLWMYQTVTRDIPVQDGHIPGLNWPAIRDAAKFAAPTLAFWVVIYVWLDRYRPQRVLVWYLTLGWGASVATAASLLINTWAGQRLSIAGDGDPASGARAAIFVAPFVEEATKASILFAIALVLRYQLVSKLTAFVLGGLSAAGFAFSENIIYYARAIVFTSSQISAGDPETAIRGLVFLRGFMTAFGHPLFTSLTALGLLVAVRTRSKVVRVIAPLVGFLAASFLHMTFNTVASVLPEQAQLMMYFLIALPLLLTVVVFAIRQIFVEGRRMRDRLTDYVRGGWLTDADVWVFSRQRSRWRATFIAATWGWVPLVATVRVQRSVTELAYLRDAMTKGVIDSAGHARERELLETIRGLREIAVVDPRGQRARLPSLRRRRAEPPPSTPPAGPPLGSMQYAPVDPRWAPPPG